MTIFLAALAIARLIDLSNVATRFGRTTVQAEGWYGERRPWQREAIVFILAAAAAVTVLLALATRRAGAMAVIATIATTALFGFVLVRAVSLHDVDAILATGFGPVTLSRLVEFGLLTILALTAMLTRNGASRER